MILFDENRTWYISQHKMTTLEFSKQIVYRDISFCLTEILCEDTVHDL